MSYSKKNTKKKIFFVLNTNVMFGAELVNLEIINSLRDKYDFYWVSQSGDVDSFLIDSNIKHIKISNLTVRELKRVVKQYRPDILHATDYRATVICALAGGGIPIIAHVHNNSPWLKRICPYAIVFGAAAWRSEYVLAVSDSIEREYVFSRLLHKKIKTIGNPVSHRRIKLYLKDDAEIKKKYDICCVARLVKQKNPERFLRILKRLKKSNPRIRAVWVGEGEMTEQICWLAEDMDLKDNIEFVGYKKNPYKIMSQSKIFVLTSSWEGYGLAAYEALALGLPCVVSRVGGLPEIITNECGKTCESEQDFVVEIKRLLKNEKYYKTKASAAKYRACLLEEQNSTIDMVDECYGNIVSQRLHA